MRDISSRAASPSADRRVCLSLFSRPRVGIVPTRPPETARRRAQARQIAYATVARFPQTASTVAAFRRVERSKRRFVFSFFARLADDSPPRDWSLTSLLFFVKHTGPNDRDCPQEEAFGEDQQPLDRGCVSGGYPEEARGEVGCPRRRARRRASRDQGAPAQGEGRQEGQEVNVKASLLGSFSDHTLGFEYTRHEAKG